MPRRPLKWFVSAALIAIGCGGSPSNRSASPPPASVAGAKPGPPVAAAPEVPTPFRDPGGVPDQFRELWKEAVSGGEQGEWGGYTYRYAVRGDRAVAVMLPRPIMRDDTIFVATVPDLAQRAFKAKLSGSPQLEPTPHGNAIAFWAGRRTITCSPSRTRPARARTGQANHTRCFCGAAVAEGGRRADVLTPNATLHIEVQLPPIAHDVTLKAIERSLRAPSVTPKEEVVKRTLRSRERSDESRTTGDRPSRSVRVAEGP